MICNVNTLSKELVCAGYGLCDVGLRTMCVYGSVYMLVIEFPTIASAVCNQVVDFPVDEDKGNYIVIT